MFIYLVIYVNFTIKIKLLINVENINREVKDTKHKIVKFYNQLLLSKNFKDITKNDFKKLKSHYRNFHVAIKKIFFFKKCYVSIDVFFKKFKKRTRNETKKIINNIFNNKNNNKKNNDNKKNIFKKFKKRIRNETKKIINNTFNNKKIIKTLFLKNPKSVFESSQKILLITFLAKKKITKKRITKKKITKKKITKKNIN